MKKIILIFVLSLPQITFACRELNWSQEEWMKNSNSIYRGVVTSISIPESDVLKPDETGLDNKKFVLMLPDRVNVKLKIYETLKGKEKSELKVILDSCGGGNYELGHMVVLFEIGNKWHAKLFHSEISL